MDRLILRLLLDFFLAMRGLDLLELLELTLRELLLAQVLLSLLVPVPLLRIEWASVGSGAVTTGSE